MAKVITIIIRFLVGGIVVTAFALLGEVIGPKSLAGVFGAAPSVAVATLGLTIWAEGRAFTAQEAQSMIWAAFAFFFYACCCLVLLDLRKWSATKASVASLPLWFACAFGFWLVFLR
ncbi:MAG: DUF3147 family protein [Candidatus Acidiferrum sp.]